jgi:pyruvate dehydrogenase E2 component (dihydrolipoamide acetyltransferase)
MAYEVALPRLGWNMETGRVGEWLKRDGERVAAGELLFTVEGDKATQEVEALESGVLRLLPDGPQPGQEVPVGTVLAYLLAPGEELPQAGAAPVTAAPAEANAAEVGVAAAAPVTAGAGGFAPTISPRARRVAGELGVDWTALTGSGRTGRIVERDVRAAAQAARAPQAEKVSPLARRLAAELGVDADALAATMPGKRIERADVAQAAARRAAETAAPVEAGPAPVAPVMGETTPISFVRRAIAERMAASSHTAAPVTLTTEADATELVRLRKQLQADAPQGDAPQGRVTPSYTDLLAKLCAAALTEHPHLNARFAGDGILHPATVNIGVAVDTPRGLLVPVLRDVPAKSLRQVAAEAARLVEQARTGKIAADDLQGGTFTITNLGMHDIDAFTPIINLPECAILGAGRIAPKQVVVDADAEKVAIRHMMFLSLTFDHRLVDGAPAARFLQRVKQYVERPFLWLVA